MTIKEKTTFALVTGVYVFSFYV